jgi:hypothetical protein
MIDIGFWSPGQPKTDVDHEMQLALSRYFDGTLHSSRRPR